MGMVARQTWHESDLMNFAPVTIQIQSGIFSRWWRQTQKRTSIFCIRSDTGCVCVTYSLYADILPADTLFDTVTSWDVERLMFGRCHSSSPRKKQNTTTFDCVVSLKTCGWAIWWFAHFSAIFTIKIVKLWNLVLPWTILICLIIIILSHLKLI